MTTKAEAVAQWKQMQNSESDLREFAHDWREQGKTRQFLADVFDFDTTKSMKWWDDLVVDVETKLEELSNAVAAAPIIVHHFKVASFKQNNGVREDVTTFSYGADFEGAKAWATQLYQEVTGGCKTMAFETRTLEEMKQCLDESNSSDFIVYHTNMDLGVHITMVPVAI